MDITHEEALKFCVEDFYTSLENAITAAGGRLRIEDEMTIQELAECLAQNGVRFVYDRNRGIDNVGTITVPCFMPAPGGMADPRPRRK
jgi:hypothetical protein